MKKRKSGQPHKGWKDAVRKRMLRSRAGTELEVSERLGNARAPASDPGSGEKLDGGPCPVRESRAP